MLGNKHFGADCLLLENTFPLHLPDYGLGSMCSRFQAALLQNQPFGKKACGA
jgi:hypothetical protein